jgi:hypothetical protein
MNCDQFERRMQELLDLRRDVRDDDLLDQHAAACPSCRDQRALWARLGDALEPGETFGVDADSPADACPRPVSRERESLDFGGGRGRHRRLLVSVFATVAAVAVMWIPDRLRERTAVSERSVAESFSTVQPPRREGSITPPADKRFLARAVTTPAEATTTFPPEFDGGFGLPPDPWQPERWWSHVADDRWNAFAGVDAGVDSVREGVAPIGRSVRRAMSILITRVTSAAISSPRPPAELPVDRINEQTSRWSAEAGSPGVA